MSRKKIIFIEGNIGAGKSTLLRLLGERLLIKMLVEPDVEWKTNPIGDGKSILDLYHHDKKRWSYSLMAYTFLARLKALEAFVNKHPESVILAERSIYCDMHCFAKNGFESEYMSRVEWQAYQEWSSWLAAKSIQPDAFIYIRVDPEVCYQRINKRRFPAPSRNSVQFLTNVHNRHDDWLMSNKTTKPVLIIDGNSDFEASEKKQNAIALSVEKFMKNIR